MIVCACRYLVRSGSPPPPCTVCVLACACVCMCVHVCACVCMCVHVCACVCMCVTQGRRQWHRTRAGGFRVSGEGGRYGGASWAILMQHHFYLSPRVFVGVAVWTQGRDAAHNLWISEPRHVQVHPGSDTEVGWLHYFLQQLRSHSISFTGARSAPMYKIGLGRGRMGESGYMDTWFACALL